MSASRFFPLLIPVILLSISFWKAGLAEQFQQAKDVRARKIASEARLVELQAIDVAHGYNEKKCAELIGEFCQLTGLELNSESPLTKGEASGQVARFVEAVTDGLRDEGFASGPSAYLLFRSVTPGQRQEFDPFLSVDFELNLEGRFFALPAFFDMLTKIAKDQRCAISIGELEVSKLDPTVNSGRLAITLPLRAYFLAK